jgi:hypothetical protein
MSIKNKYVKRSKISEAKFRKLMRHFAMDLDAKTIATLTGLNRNTVNRYLTLLRERIAEFCLHKSLFQGNAEYVRSHLLNKGTRDEKHTPASANLPVFGVLQCKDKICTIVQPKNEMHNSSQCGIYKRLIFENVNTSQVQNEKESLPPHESLIDGIESFLSFTRKRLTKFHGIPESTFYLHLKECEFRYNYRNDEIYPILLKIIRNNPLC